MALWIPFALLAIASAFDLSRKEIPDTLTVLLLLWAVTATSAGWSDIGWTRALIGVLIAFGLGALAFRFGLLGGGDVKLMVGLGACLGPLGLCVTLMLSALVGGILSLVALARGERDVAYAPAMAGGLLLAILISGAHVHGMRA
jgi:prepilin peptidase CpaA